MFQSLRIRLSLVFISLAILPIVIFGLVLSSKSFHALQEEAISHQEVEAEKVSIAIEDYIFELVRMLELIPLSHDFISLSRQDLEKILTEFLSHENRFEELTLIDNAGKEIIRCNRTQVVFDSDLADRSHDPVFTQTIASKKRSFSRVQFTPVSGEPYMVLSIPLQSFFTGQIKYVLMGTIRLKKVWDLLVSLSHEGEIVFITDKDGNVVGHPNPSVVLGGVKYTLPDNSPGVTYDLAGTEVIMALTRIAFGEESLLVIAQKNVDEALSLAKSVVSISIIVIIISLIVAISLSILIIGNIVRPIEHLSSVAKEIQGGDLNKQAKCFQNDEVGHLAQAFNEMTSNLRQSIFSLENEIAVRRKAEKEVAFAFERFKTVMNSIDALVYVADMENYELLFVNQYGQSQFGAEDIVGQICWQTLQAGQKGPCDFCPNKYLLDADGKPGAPYSWEFQNTVTGQWLHIIDKAIIWNDQRIVKLQIATDISTLKETEAELVAHKDNLEILVKERTAQLESVNKNLEKEVAERKNAQQELLQAYASLEKAHQQLVLSQANLVQAEKLSTIGTLAAGVAHELNNPMMGILNYVQYCQLQLTGQEKLQGVLNDAEKETKRCINIVKNLLTFARYGLEKEKQHVACSAVFERILSLLSYRIDKEQINIKKEFGDGTLSFYGVPDEIQQVFLNLISNAIDSMQESEEKNLLISLTRKDNGVLCTITDTGSGISQESIIKIFDPFYTTKPVGKGTGLGLSVTKNIIETHNGIISCSSTMATGTSFTVFLPEKTA